jgi:hypothetical protein
MILYVNGDSHTAAAEAVNTHAFAGDDGALTFGDRRPHPENLAASWGAGLAELLENEFECGAESASSNDRIIRTTREWLMWNQLAYVNNKPLVMIQWSTWEREEWEHNGTYYQVNGSGIDMVPPELQERYRHYIVGIDWQRKTQEAHEKIWEFHQELLHLDIPHVFFNGNSDFGSIKEHYHWGQYYMAPYDSALTYNAILRSNGYQTVNPNSWHFGKDAHCFFAQYMLQYIIDNKIQ